jgi:hypothetical protein
MKAIVYEPFMHFIPTGEGWARGFEDLGWTVYRLPAFQYKITEVAEEVDLLIIHDLSSEVIEDLKTYKKTFPNTQVAILCDHWRPHFETAKDLVDLWFELSVVHTHSKKEFDVRGMRFGHVQLSAHKNDFFPTNVPKIYDVSFVGQLTHGYRGEDKYLHPVLDRNYHGVFGGGFTYKGRTYPHIGHDQLNHIYNNTKVNINFHYPLHKMERADDLEYRLEVNGRVFEIALSGNFQISDNPLVERFFGDSIPIVNENNWIEKIDYYISNPEERDILSKKAYYICVNNHMYSHRASKILDLLRKF